MIGPRENGGTSTELPTKEGVPSEVTECPPELQFHRTAAPAAMVTFVGVKALLDTTTTGTALTTVEENRAGDPLKPTAVALTVAAPVALPAWTN